MSTKISTPDRSKHWRTRFHRWRIQTVRKLWKAAYELPSVELDQIAPPSINVDPPIMDHVCLPPYLGPKDHNDFIPLMRIAKSLNPQKIVELGTAYGNSTANLCKQCPGAIIHTVNAPVQEQSGHCVTYELTESDIGKVYKANGYSDRVVQIFSNTLTVDFSKHLKTESVDLAIIDACHDTEYVINDFEKVRPYLRKGGLAMFHDTHPSMEFHLHGSYVACMKLRSQGFDVRHIANTWWGIWVKP